MNRISIHSQKPLFIIITQKPTNVQPFAQNSVYSVYFMFGSKCIDKTFFFMYNNVTKKITRSICKLSAWVICVVGRARCALGDEEIAVKIRGNSHYRNLKACLYQVGMLIEP